jgi:hypothetical protein
MKLERWKRKKQVRMRARMRKISGRKKDI